MTPNLKNLSVSLNNIDTVKLIESWIWLIGNDKQPIIVTSIGDMFLKDKQGQVYWLNVGEGYIDKVANSQSSFEEMLLDEDLVDEWFLPQLAAEIKASGLELTDGKVFSYLKLPILGGHYAAENFMVTEIATHFQLTGEINRQVAGLLARRNKCEHQCSRLKITIAQQGVACMLSYASPIGCTSTLSGIQSTENSSI